MTFDIKIDGELQLDTFLHRLVKSWDLLSSKLVPGDEGHKCLSAISGSRAYHAFFKTNLLFTEDTLHSTLIRDTPNFSMPGL